jgi:parallel beta-helix repeat protein
MRPYLLAVIVLIALPSIGFSVTVCSSGCDYTKLSEAVASSPDGETITVKAGSYTDNVVVNKSLTITGEGDVVISPETGKLPVFYIISTSAVTIKNIRVSGENQACFEIEGSESVTLSDASLDNCFYGIRITDSSSISLKNLNINSPSFGIDIRNSSSVTVEDSVVKSPSVAGVTATGSLNSIFRKVTSTPQSTASGFYFVNSHGNTLSQLSLSGGDVAIVLDSSNSNIIKASTISGPKEGIELINSDSNEITENVISSSQVGLYLESSKQNTIYKNDFVSNNVQAIVDNSLNYWNISVGNYWSNYEGEDNNGDGVGDNPYVINSLNKDFLPAMAAFFTSTQVLPPPPAGGGGGAQKSDPLVEKFSELTPELMLDILDYFDVKGRVYTLSPALSAALLALKQNNIFPATGMEVVDSRLGGYAGEYGKNVYEAIADKVGATFTFSNYAVVARGDIEADAYAAIAYAKARNIPLLLVEPHTAPEEVKQVIKRLAVKRIIIIGGPKAISQEVEKELSTLAEVTRIYGTTRVETSIRVAQATKGVKRDIKVIVIQDGWNPRQDGAIVASLYEAPILYVRGETLPQATEAYLREFAGKDVKVVFVGVAPTVKEKIKNILS